MTSTQPNPAASATLDWLESSQPGFGSLAGINGGDTIEMRYTGPADPHYSVNETWWFEASAPEHGLTVNFYIAMRPNLKICSAGAWMWTGHKSAQLLADHLNFHTFLPEPEFSGNSISVPAVGLHIEFIEPYRQIRIRYQPPGLNVTAELTVRALWAPVVRANNRHFEQATWTTGTVTIAGQRYDLDGPSFRDRSWGEPRREDQLAHPPIAWLYGALDNGRVAFNLSGCDDPARDPVWASAYPEIGDARLFDGWLMRDGELKKIVSMSKQTRRDPACQRQPQAIDVRFVDEDGIDHYLQGRIATSYNMHFWPNLNTWVGLTHWTLDGIEGYGGSQDYAWPDYSKRCW
jgi:hypothetical protein